MKDRAKFEVGVRLYNGTKEILPDLMESKNSFSSMRCLDNWPSVYYYLACLETNMRSKRAYIKKGLDSLGKKIKSETDQGQKIYWKNYLNKIQDYANEVHMEIPSNTELTLKYSRKM